MTKRVEIHLHRADSNSVSININGKLRCTVSGIDKNKATMSIVRAHLPANQDFDFSTLSQFLADPTARGIRVIYTYERQLRGEEYLGADHD